MCVLSMTEKIIAIHVSLIPIPDRPDMALDAYRGRKTTIQYNTIVIHRFFFQIFYICKVLVCFCHGCGLKLNNRPRLFFVF